MICLCLRTRKKRPKARRKREKETQKFYSKLICTAKLVPERLQELSEDLKVTHICALAFCILGDLKVHFDDRGGGCCHPTDSKANKVVVKGKTANPTKFYERLLKKYGRKVELVSPLPKPPPPEEEKKEPETKEEKKEEVTKIKI
ncbi:hypothetical protein F3Y22_tig00111036pilonHSYRG00014 [Hibiscus syriacus]|uniref:Uncharacterized protein n=1 Tax=Hibiscus syriacus TaxID=106335 RepID=A0A6A2Z517_HIBSY|nr:hypothetical protein F3Y22_tig00111036pilonHSYRG00014 [Hibiscus syriacus]